MKLISVLRTGLVTMLCLVVTQIGSSVYAGWGDCSAPPDPGGCPIKINGVVAFDRCYGSALTDDSPTTQGNTICDLILQLNDAKKKLQNFPEPWKSQIESELDDWIQATVRGAIDQDAINTLNNASHYLDIILDDINGYINDPVCGVHGTIQKVDGWLENRAKEFETWGKLAGMSGNIIHSVNMSAASAAQAGVRLAAIMANPDTYSEETLDSLRNLQVNLDKYYKALQDLVDTDISAFTDGVSQGLEVAQWTVQVGACAGLLADSVKNYASAATATIGGASACPETIEAVGGSCWGVPGGVVVGGFGVLEDVVASIPCEKAVNGAAHASEYGHTLVRVVKTVQELINKTAICYTQYNLVMAAVEQLAVNASGDIGRSMGPVEEKLAESKRHLEDANRILEQDLFPVVKVYAEGRIDEFAKNVEHVLFCRDKAHLVALEAGQDVVNASTKLADALSHAVDAGRVVGNIQSGIERGWNNVASRSAIRSNHDFSEAKRKVDDWSRKFTSGIEALVEGDWKKAVGQASSLILSLGDQLHQIVTQVYQDFKNGYTCSECTEAKGEFGTAKRKAALAFSTLKQKVQQYSPSVTRLSPSVHVDMGVSGALPSLAMPSTPRLKRMPRIPTNASAAMARRGQGRSDGDRSRSGRQAAMTSHLGKNPEKNNVSEKSGSPLQVRKASNAYVKIAAGDRQTLRFDGSGLDRISKIEIMDGRRTAKDVRAAIKRKSKNRLELELSAGKHAKPGRYGLMLHAGKEKHAVPEKLVRLEVTKMMTRPVTGKPGKGTSLAAGKGKGKGSTAPQVKRASTRQIKIAAGGMQKLRLDGSGLDHISKVDIMDGRRAARDVAATIKRKSKNRLELDLSAGKHAKPGRYGLVLHAGKEKYTVPEKLVRLEVTRMLIRPVTGKPGKGNSLAAGKGKSKGSVAPQVKRASTRHIKIAAGGTQKLRLNGSGLDRISKIEIMDGRRTAKDVRAAIKRKSKNRLELELSAGKHAKPGRYGLMLHSGKEKHAVPEKLVRLEVTRMMTRPVTGKPGKGTSLAAGKGKGKGSVAPQVKRASDRHLKIVAGEQEDIRLDGTNLKTVSKVVVMERKKPVHGALVSINRKTKSRLDLTVATDKRVKPGRYTLRLFVGKAITDIPGKQVTIEVSKPKPTAHKVVAVTHAGKGSSNKGHAAKSGGGKSPMVKSARPGHVLLVPGGKGEPVTLKGAYLKGVDKVDIVAGKHATREIRAKIKKKSSGSMVVTLKPEAKVKKAGTYQLRIWSGKTPVILAKRILTIEVAPAGKPGKGYHPAKR